MQQRTRGTLFGLPLLQGGRARSVSEYVPRRPEGTGGRPLGFGHLPPRKLSAGGPFGGGGGGGQEGRFGGGEEGPEPVSSSGVRCMTAGRRNPSQPLHSVTRVRRGYVDETALSVGREGHFQLAGTRPCLTCRMARTACCARAMLHGTGLCSAGETGPHHWQILGALALAPPDQTAEFGLTCCSTL